MNWNERRWRPSPATLISLAALFVALAGTGYAAMVAKAPKNSVVSKSVKDNSLKARDLKDGKAVGSAEVIDDSLTGADIADETISGAEIGDDSVGVGELDDRLSAFAAGRNRGHVPLGSGTANITPIVTANGTRFADMPGVVLAKVTVRNSTNSTRGAECRLQSPDGAQLDQVDDSEGTLGPATGDNDEAHALIGFDTIQAGDYRLACYGAGGAAGDVETREASIVIIPAGSGEVPVE